MQVDYIIVGFGLAGLAFTETLEYRQKSFMVIADDSQRSSKVAGGVYNPVILKRFTPVWDAQEQLKIAIPFYKKLEEKFNMRYDHVFDIHRVFNSVEEQNDWFAACDKPVLSQYLQAEVCTNENRGIHAPYGLGKLTGTGMIAVNELLSDYQQYLYHRDKLKSETFEHEKITFLDNMVHYKGISTKHIIFCEGFGLKKNPFFKNLPLTGTKGELITIHAPDLKLKNLIKSSVFILPLGDDLYKVGATFNWLDKTSKPTEAAKNELVKKLEILIKTPYKIISQQAGIRPTVKDRRPLIGVHDAYQQLAVLNGLGTRGVMLAPKMAQLLFDHLENGTDLPREISINRFY